MYGDPLYTLDKVLERTSTRLLPLNSRAAEYAPMAPACCNACRVCATTNLAGLAFAAGAAAVAALGRVAKRFQHS
jgi:hypothetical protein